MPGGEGPAGGGQAAAGTPEGGAGGIDVRLLVPALVAWGLTALAVPLAPGVLAALVAAGLLPGLLTAGLAWRAGHGRFARVLALCLVVTAAVLGSLALQRATRLAGPVEQLAGQRAVVTITARVRGDVRLLNRLGEGAEGTGQRPGEAAEVARQPARRRPGPPERATAVVRAEASQVRARGQQATVRTPVLVFGDESLMAVRWGDQVRLTGRLSAADPGSDAVAVLRVTSRPQIVTPAGPLLATTGYARERLRAAVDRLPPASRGLVPAMVIGDRSLTPGAVTDDMRATGLTHLSAVSGSNVTLVLGAVMLLARATGLPRRLRAPAGLAALAGFVVLARPDPSVIRAAAMGAAGLAGVMSSRPAPGLPALAGAVVVLLVADPWLAVSYGFALSVLATLGLLLFARPWGQALAGVLPGRCRALGYAIAVPAAAQVMCGPVIVLLQGAVPVIGVAANVLAAPLVAPVTIGGLAAGLVALAWLPGAQLLAWVPGLPAGLIAWIAALLARVPGGLLPWPDGPGGAALLTGLTVLALAAAPARRAMGWARAARVLGAVAAAALVAWGALVLPWPGGRPGHGSWQLAACDVGQGDGLVLATGEPGHAVVVDAGLDPGLMDRCLHHLGVRVIDALVLTHYDSDHIGGTPGAVAGREVAQVVVSAAAEQDGRPRQVSAVVRAGVPLRAVRAGDELTWTGGSARVLGPSASAGPDAGNDGSVVLDVTTPQLRMLLLGDAEQQASADVLRALQASAQQRAFDVVKVSHHGSRNVVRGLYRYLAARVGVISVGADNDYGHPAPSVLADLAAAGTAVWRTDEHGTILVSPGEGGAAGTVSVRAIRTR